MRKLSTILMLVLFTALSLEAVDFKKSVGFTADAFAQLETTNDGQIFAISDRGLLRSTDNGQTWVSLASELTASTTTDLDIDDEGRLLVINNNEVMASVDNGFSWMTLENGLSGSIVSEIEVMANGTIMAATNNGAFRLDENSMAWVKLNLNGDSSGNSILAIGEDADGNLLVSGTKSGLSISTDGGLTFNVFDIGISIGGTLSSITAIEIDDEGMVWFGSEEGELFSLNQATLELNQVLDGSLFNDAITEIDANSNLGILLNTESNGIFSSQDGENFVKLNGSGSLVSDLDITSNGDLLFLDENGLSLGSNGSGTTMLDIKFDASSVLAFSSEGNNSIVITEDLTLSGNSNGFLNVGSGAAEGMTINDVMLMGDVSIAATNMGVFKLDADTEQWVEVVAGSETGNATKIEISSQNKILIGTENGLLISEDSDFENYEIVDFTGALDFDTEVTDLEVSSSGQISITNNSLLYTSDDEGETFESVSLGLTLSLIGSLEWDANGNVYIGTNGNGIFKSDNNGLTFVKLDGVLETENILSIEAQGNRVFVQTDNALMLSNDGGANFDNLTSGLNISNISSFELTSNGRIELVTDNGIFTSDDNGLSFDEQELNINLGTMVDVSSDSEGNIMLATELNGLFESDDNGMTWIDVNTNLESTNITSLQINRNDNNKIFLGTDNGLMVSLDGGLTFNEDSNTELEGQIINDLKLTSDNELMVMFGNDSRVGIIGSNGILEEISVNGSNSGILSVEQSGNILSVSTEDGLFVSVDGGLNFEEVEGEGGFTNIAGVVDFAFNSSNRLVLATDNMLFSRENGETTDITGSLSLDNITNLELMDNGNLTFISDGKLMQSVDASLSSFTDITGNLSGSQSGVLDFEITENGQLTILTNNGIFTGKDDNQNRDEIDIDLTNIGFNKLVVVSDTKILAATDGGLFESINLGNTFDRIMLEGRVVLDAAVNSSNEIFAATEDNGFLKLNANGEILTDLSAQFDGEIVEDVESDGENIIIASSSSIVKISNDGGLTFNSLDGNITTMSEVISDAEGNLVIVSDNGTVLMLDATTKALTELEFTGNAEEINGFGTDFAGNLYLSTELNGVFRSSDDGQTFIAVNNGLTSTQIIDLTSSEVGNVYALTLDGVFQFDTETMGWVNVVSNTEGEFESATDLKAFGGPVLTLINSVGGPNNDILVMSTDKGFYYTAPLSLATVGEIADRVIKIYPNPSTNLNSLTLTMDNPAEADLAVYNANGQMFAKLNDLALNEGPNEITLNLTNIIAGVYFIELKLENLTLTKQVVIVK